MKTMKRFGSPMRSTIDDGPGALSGSDHVIELIRGPMELEKEIIHSISPFSPDIPLTKRPASFIGMEYPVEPTGGQDI